MTIKVTEIYEMSSIESLFHERVAHDCSNTSEQVIVVYISSAAEENSWLQKWFKPANLSDEERENILWVKLVNGTKECLLFKSIFPSSSAPSINILQNGLLECSIQGNSLSREQDPWETFINGLQSVFKGQTTKRKLFSKSDEEYQRVKRMIQNDKLERKYVFQNTNDTKRKVQKWKQLTVTDNVSYKSQKGFLAQNYCTLQLKLPNGYTISNTFPSQTKLHKVRMWLDYNCYDDGTPYLFHRNVPRVTLTQNDELKSLQELDLLPRSTLILEPLEVNNKKFDYMEQSSLLHKVYSGLTSFWAKEPEADASSAHLGYQRLGTNVSHSTNYTLQKLSSLDMVSDGGGGGDSMAPSAYTTPRMYPSNGASQLRQNVSELNLSSNNSASNTKVRTLGYSNNSNNSGNN
ncbi:Ubx6p [Saccharomyces paradoxus]|uniref:Ubx6p n=1 Tax=Saccharomyces paradoxus TaxID=27291 RepID=A0A8B8UU02_SACPA|nr:Ubx6 [Saccharomyces paradoxus]QHS74202.1 Ubx6 [Saccharomyces paradoxus]